MQECSPKVWETRARSHVESYQTQNMVLDTSLLNTQHYKVRIKSKIEQSMERGSTLQYLGVVAIEKGALGSPPTTVANYLLDVFII